MDLGINLDLAILWDEFIWNRHSFRNRYALFNDGIMLHTGLNIASEVIDKLVNQDIL